MTNRFNLGAGLVLIFLLLPSYVAAEINISLITVSPGDASWQAFGHNALWVADTTTGREAIYNFGIFDFEAPGFILNFVRGRMQYQLAAVRPDYNLNVYVREQRRVVAHPLNLSDEETARLLEHLTWHEQPENATYRYHYFLDNCSTKIRDALDLALDGALQKALNSRPTEDTFRSASDRYANALPWMQVGINVALGNPVDQPISEWQRAFLPDSLLASLISVMPHRLGAPQLLNPGAAKKAHGWSPLLVTALVIAALVMLLALHQVRWARVGWAAASGVVGLALLLVWLGTDHTSATWNASVLVFSPLFLALGLRPGDRWLTGICALGVAGGLILTPDAVTRTLGGFQLAALLVAAYAARRSVSAVEPP